MTKLLVFHFPNEVLICENDTILPILSSNSVLDAQEIRLNPASNQHKNGML
jgi:hypothetical protein